MKKIITLILVSLSVMLIAQNKIIVVDPGHGLTTNFPTNESNGTSKIVYKGQNLWNPTGKWIQESENTLAVGLKLRKMLQDTFTNADVRMTRETMVMDPWLNASDRGIFANRVNADVALAIHTNGSETNVTASGTAAMYCAEHTNNGSVVTENPWKVQDRQFATFLSNRAREKTGFGCWQGCVAEDRSVSPNHYGHLKWGNTKGKSLVEMGFHSTPSELAYLSSESGQKAFAWAYMLAIEDYFTWLDATEHTGKLVRKPLTPPCDQFELATANNYVTLFTGLVGSTTKTMYAQACLSSVNNVPDIDYYGFAPVKGMSGTLHLTVISDRPVKANTGGFIQTGVTLANVTTFSVFTGCDLNFQQIKLEDVSPNGTPNNYRLTAKWTPTTTLQDTPASAITGASTVCNSSQVANYSMTTTNTAMQYKWYSQEGTLLGVTTGNGSINLTFPSSKTFTVRDAFCRTYTKSVTLSAPTGVAITAPSGTTIPTQNGSTTLWANCDQSNVTYRWSSGNTSKGIIVSAGNYTTTNYYSVTVTGTNGCSSNASIAVNTVKPDVLPSLSVSPTTVVDGGYINLQSFYKNTVLVPSPSMTATIGISNGKTTTQNTVQTVNVSSIPGAGSVQTSNTRIKLPLLGVARNTAVGRFIVLKLNDNANEDNANNTVYVQITVVSVQNNNGYLIAQNNTKPQQVQEKQKLDELIVTDNLIIKPDSSSINHTGNIIIITTKDQPANVLIADISGYVIERFTLSQNSQREIDKADLPNGIYVVSIQEGAKVRAVKFTVTK
jgi:N-acetylmuramoyl-L-alanine amidase